MRNVVGYIITWIVFFGVWLLMIADTSWRDWVIGGIATTLASAATVWTGLNMTVKFRPTVRNLLQVWRLPAAVVLGTIDLLQELVRQLFTRAGAESRIAGVPFDVGGDDACSAGRRALAVTYTTITPNSIVLGWVKEQGSDGYMMYHQIKSRPVSGVMKALGAKVR